ncbi:MAG: CapA family protein [Candidatus Binataceae bacterium]
MNETHLLLVGDVMLGRMVDAVLGRSDPSYPWGDTIDILGNADWRCCNLECVISDRGEPWEPEFKAFHFRSAFKNLAVLKSAHIDAVSLANNHSLDFGYAALSQTLDGLDSSGIRHAGAGANLDAAVRLATSTVKDPKIGLLAFTDNQPEWEATKTKPGVLYSPIDMDDERAKRLFNLVEEARASVDLLLVAAHWGPNWGYRPPVEHPRFAHALIDHGADIIFGHSGHVFRGIEMYKKRVILYCAGNFIDDYAVDEVERNDESFIFLIDLNRDSTIKRLRLHPTIIGDCQARLAHGVRADRIASKMKELCDEFQVRSTWRAEETMLEVPVD